MNDQETLVWVKDLLPGEPQVSSRKVGESFPSFEVAEIFLVDDATPDRPETVAMTLNASQIEPALETEDGSDLRVELLTITTGHSSTAAELVTAAATMIAENPAARSPQPGTFLPQLGPSVDSSITAKHGLLVVPFVWEEGVPHAHEVTSGGKRSAQTATSDIEFTHPGRLTVPAQLIMLTDAEYDLALREGLGAVQTAMAEQAVNLNDLWRVPAEL